MKTNEERLINISRLNKAIIEAKLSCKKLEVVHYLFENMDSKNKVKDITQQSLMIKLGLNRKTVSGAFVGLQAVGFLKKIDSDYVINPMIVAVSENWARNVRIAKEYGFLSLNENPAKEF